MPSESKKSFEISKLDDEHRVAYGWASVISEKGVPVVDSQNDVIEPGEMLKAATDFMLDVRTAKAMHQGGKVGEVIHSMPLTADICKSLGLSSDREGWAVGVKIHSDEVWKKVKSGEFKAFSIGAYADRVPI